jgi:hypothetical protein
VDPRAGLEEVEKRKFLTLPGPELHPSVVQPVGSRYTEYAIQISQEEYYFLRCDDVYSGNFTDIPEEGTAYIFFFNFP